MFDIATSSISCDMVDYHYLSHGDDDGIVDTELLEFLNVDMPTLFPEIVKDLEGNDTTKTEEPSASAIDVDDSTAAIALANSIAVQTPLVYKTALLSSIEVVPATLLMPAITSTTSATTPSKKRPAPIAISRSPSIVSPLEERYADAHVVTPTFKKRRTSSSSSSISSSSSAGQNSSNDSNKSEEEIMEDRKLRNREHARRSRLKKKGMEIQLKESMEQLKQENQKLRDLITSSSVVDDVDVDTMVQEYVNRPTVNFTKAVEQPENRVLNTKTIQFLQSLSKELTTGSKKKKPTSPKSTIKTANLNVPLAVVG